MQVRLQNERRGLQPFAGLQQEQLQVRLQEQGRGEEMS